MRIAAARAMQITRLWGVVLAGGEGKRLAALTRALYGVELPKQFAVLEGGRSLLQATLDRMGALIPRERTVVVVSAAYEAIARRQLAAYPGVDIAVQPTNLDTGPGILFPLARIRARDPGAHVAIFPSDHHLADATPMLEAIRRITAWRGPGAGRLVLIGVVPHRAETDYGWILPGQQLLRSLAVSAVHRFVEKPHAELAETMLHAGGLWNTFISAGSLSSYWHLARRYLESHARRFEAYVRCVDHPCEADALADAYAQMTPASFSRAVLQRSGRLGVARVDGTGWSDWGSPQRVFASLEGTAHMDALLARIGGDGSSTPLAQLGWGSHAPRPSPQAPS